MIVATAMAIARIIVFDPALLAFVALTTVVAAAGFRLVPQYEQRVAERHHQRALSTFLGLMSAPEHHPVRSPSSRYTPASTAGRHKAVALPLSPIEVRATAPQSHRSTAA
ncbi:hypothetical protein [Umezawaea tangerina]|uniref:Uncharacterized protein n=1 Tax=Umezawaea tangerina TaxID=84725 RepID=A0A2T0SPR0_9PSEU|nr:hypothetical protein [Umezawaea tangerina]PRY35395.1 hypothetical protein CLV43_114313 [Umezawaea tangerina]